MEKQITDQIIQAVSSRNINAFAEFLAEDVRFLSIPAARAGGFLKGEIGFVGASGQRKYVVNGKANVVEEFAAYFSSATTNTWEVLRVLVDAPNVCIERNNHVVFDGRDVVIPMVTILEIKNAKITLWKDYFGADGFLGD